MFIRPTECRLGQRITNLSIEFLPCGDTALAVQLGKGIDRQLSDRVLSLHERIRAAALPGVVESVPTFRSLLVHYDPLVTSSAALTQAVEDLIEDGAVEPAVDGDQLLYILAMARHRLGQLQGPVVGTVMSNLGLERALDGLGAGLLRTQVGDRFVVEAMREGGYNLGGEQSGHLVFLDHTTTGDGLMTALQTLAIMARTERPLSELTEGFERFPQVLLNIPISERRASYPVIPSSWTGWLSS